MPRSRATLYLGLLLTTCSMLLLQQFLTRVFSIQFNSGLAFLAISLTFLGVGSAGVLVYVLPRLFPAERLPRLIPWLALAWAALLVAGLLVEVRVADTGGDAEALRGQVVRVLAASVCLLPAMVAVGLVISLVLRANAAHVGRLYGADLLGGGIGCLLVLPLMDGIGGDDGVFAIGALAAVGAVLLAHAHGQRAAAAAGLATALGLAACTLLGAGRQAVDIRSHRTVLGGVQSWVREDQEIAREWNALSRLGFFPTVDDGEIYVRIDSGCQTTVPAKDPVKTAAYVARTGFERLPFVLGRHERCLEIGAGGGRGMVLAKALGAKHVTGVEINPGIADATLRERFPGFGIDELVRDPTVRYVVGEGRSFLEGSDERFDSITITFIQTNVASGSAAFALSEANLFTVEAFMEFLGHLDERGHFYVYRHGGVECLRVIATLRAAFERLGWGDVRPSLYVARDRTNNALVLASRGPLAADEIARLDAAARELQLDVLYAPGEARETRLANPLPQRLRELRAAGNLRIGDVAAAWKQLAHDHAYEPIEGSFVRAADPDALANDLVVDVSAPDDDRPYFFFTGLARWSDAPLYFDAAGTAILGGIVIMLSWMAAAFSLLVATLIVVPLLLRRPRTNAAGARAPGAAVVLYFAGIGVGYIAVQISFVQRFVLFLGHPVHAVAVVILAFLLWSGLGSWCSERVLRRLSLRALVAVFAVVLVGYDLALPVLFHSAAIAWPVPAKILLSIALLFGLAFPMGMFFPHGIRLVERTAPELVPWAWGANSAASVIGSILALALAIQAGFHAVALTGVLVYVATVLPAGAMLRRAPAAAQHLDDLAAAGAR
jgi:spermidine synthase